MAKSEKEFVEKHGGTYKRLKNGILTHMPAGYATSILKEASHGTAKHKALKARTISVDYSKTNRGKKEIAQHEARLKKFNQS